MSEKLLVQQCSWCRDIIKKPEGLPDDINDLKKLAWQEIIVLSHGICEKCQKVLEDE